jgi:hypothetical protein
LENLKEKAKLGRPGRGWKDNVKMDLKETEYYDAG